MDNKQDRELEILEQALELEPGAERDAYLDEACGDDPELRRGVEELLEAHDEPASILEGYEGDSTPDQMGDPRELDGGEKPGDRFGRRGCA